MRGKTTRICELIKFGIDRKNLRHCFKEFAEFATACKFRNDWSHEHDPNCAVRIAVVEGKILRERYENYLSILNELQTVL